MRRYGLPTRCSKQHTSWRQGTMPGGELLTCLLLPLCFMCLAWPGCSSAVMLARTAAHAQCNSGLAFPSKGPAGAPGFLMVLGTQDSSIGILHLGYYGFQREYSGLQ